MSFTPSHSKSPWTIVKSASHCVEAGTVSATVEDSQGVNFDITVFVKGGVGNEAPEDPSEVRAALKTVRAYSKALIGMGALIAATSD